MMHLGGVAKMLDSALVGADAPLTGVATDTRQLVGGELFVALQGPNFDGHDFADVAERNGAAGLLVSHEVDSRLPFIKTRDTTIGLGSLATEWRRQFELPVVAVTGSNGKTTVKQMTGSIFAAAYGDGVVSAGNLNNHIGLPLSVLRLRDNDRFAVFELGMSNPGEIDYLSRIASPDVAIVTNAAAAHLQGLGDVHAVARAKGEIFGGLDMQGIAIINADDDFADLWRQLAGTRRCIRFAIDADAEVRGQYTLDTEGSDIVIVTPAGEFETRLSVPGRHNVINALAATAAAVAFEIPLETIGQGLASFQPAEGRLQRVALGDGVELINDAYNANPASVKAAVDVLGLCAGNRLLVLADMAELGDDAAEHHHQIGEYAAHGGIDSLYCYGELSRVTVKGFGSEARHFEDIDALVDALDTAVNATDGPATILVKGSRSMQMERVVEQMMARRQTGASPC